MYKERISNLPLKNKKGLELNIWKFMCREKKNLYLESKNTNFENDILDFSYQCRFKFV